MPTPKTVIAHHPYEPQRDDELALAEGEKVTVTDASDPDWWVGKKDDGTSGYFPSNFVDPVEEDKVADKPVELPVQNVDQAEDAPENVPNIDDNHQQQPEPAPLKPIGMARVMEDYAMQGPDELSLHRGSIVTIYERYEDGWMKGEINGKIGRFPAEHVEDIDMPGRPDFGMQAVNVPPKGAADEGEGSKPAFKLAAYGVKQGGIGSLLAGGFPGLKKTAGPKKQSPPADHEKPTEASALPPPAPSTREVVTQNEPAPSNPAVEYVAKAIVLHPYDAQNDDELNLLRGEYINVIDKNVDEGWWKGTTERGQTGVFPSNFVKEIEEQTIASPPPVRSRKSVTSTGSQQSFTSAASRVSTGISARPPPVPGKTSRPPSVASTSRPSSVHDQQPPSQQSSSAVSPVPIPEESSQEPRAASVGTSAPVDDVKDSEDAENIPSAPASLEKQEQDIPAETVSASTPSPPSIPKRPSAPAINDTNESISSSAPEGSPAEASLEKPDKVEAEEGSVSNEATAEKGQSELPASVQEAAKEPVGTTDNPKAEETRSIKEEVREAETTKDEEATPEQAEKEQKGIAAESEENNHEDKSLEDEKKQHFDMQPTGPKLSTPSRARPGRPRRAPEIRKDEPSQVELLQQELAQTPEEPKRQEEKAPSPPSKPVKPIFAKFPTPFAGGAPPELKNLKPVQRRMWEPAPAHEPKEQEDKKDDNEAPRPAGVKNIASRFNVPSSGGNEVLETKLKNFTKNEVEKTRKELERQLQEERDKRIKLEELVSTLAEQVKQLQAQLQQ